ncbi:MAG: LacI family DNA-binding transcriptional regulator [Nitriliruptorales bacterium]|nr:LacI family DNA-binding transcriptional regulator [Nitriliruptorales bacterium]
MQHGQEKATLKDVADAVGVHASTVSRALSPEKRNLVNPETREEIERVAAELDYRPDRVARSLRRGRTNVIGVVVADLSNPFIGPVLRGIENALAGRGGMPMMVESRDSSDRLTRVCEALVDHRVDAILTTAGRTGDLSTLRKVAARVPLVLAVRALPRLNVPTLAHDDVLGGRLAANHLIGLGHERLAELVGPDDISSFRERGRGFRQAADEAGLSVLEIADEIVLPTVDEGRRLMELLLRDHGDDLPTGVFVHNDTMAVGALDAAREAGLVCPDDISIVGYNNNPLTAYLAPPLTTIHLPGYELGRMAADTVIAMLDEPEVTPHTVSLPPRLIERGSTAPPPSP